MTLIVCATTFVMDRFIKEVIENHQLAKSISPVSIGINLVWNFFYFAINFQFSI